MHDFTEFGQLRIRPRHPFATQNGETVSTCNVSLTAFL
jgi:hypothetical protein